MHYRQPDFILGSYSSSRLSPRVPSVLLNTRDMAARHSLDRVPPEVLLQILAYLEVNDLLQISRTCHTLRDLARDPILHLARLHRASWALSYALEHRPSRASISPPNAWIWLSKTNVLSRQISKSLIRIRLSHNLEHRPHPQDLVARSILPASCTTYSSLVSPALIQSQQAVEKQRLKDGLCRKLERRPSVKSLVSMQIMPEECARRTISPTIFATRRKVIRENLKDGLRAWVEGRGIQAQKRKADEMEASERSTVKSLAKRFTAKILEEQESNNDPVFLEKKSAQVRWARRKEERRISVNGGCAQPTRARVLGLKRFWEGVIRAAAS
jgi:F-box domain